MHPPSPPRRAFLGSVRAQRGHGTIFLPWSHALSPLTFAERLDSHEISRRPAPDPRFEMRQILSNGHRSLHAAQAFKAGEILAGFGAAEKVISPNYLTVQVGETEHIMLSPRHLELINHSCDPNVFFDVSSGELKALKDIAKDEELVFFYPSTEWRMDQPFQCHCRSEGCLEVIQGAAHLSEDVLERYELNQHIRDLAKQSSVPAL